MEATTICVNSTSDPNPCAWLWIGVKMVTASRPSRKSKSNTNNNPINFKHQSTMSSTSRGSARNENDFYVTPIPPITHFLTELAKDVDISDCLSIVDPCAGGDADNPMSYPTAIGYKAGTLFPDRVMVHTMDIREDSRATIKDDYLARELNGSPPDMVISNPPFSLAVEFVQKALDEVRMGGLVIFLQRLNFFGSGKRLTFWQNRMPSYTYIHSTRMGFKTERSEDLRIAMETAAGKVPRKKDPSGTDSIEYAHFVWVRGVNPKFTMTRVI